MVEKSCECCKRPFLVQVGELNRGNGKYCSPACRHKSQKGQERAAGPSGPELTCLYQAGKSIPEIAASTGLTRSTVRYRLRQSGCSLRSRTSGIRLVSEKLSFARKGKKRAPFSEEIRQRIAEARLNAPARGFTTRKNGYQTFTRGPHKGRQVHNVLVEQKLGRRLLENEVVHHKDENPSNNDLSNLVVMTRADHTRLHSTLNYSRRQRDQHGRFR